MIRWSNRALGEGKMPNERHDHLPWTNADADRQAAAGDPIVKGACLYIKGDWSEFAGTVGFPPWNDGIRPCFGCNAFGELLYHTAGISLETMIDSICNDELAYFQACDACEHCVRLERLLDRQQICQYLRYDKRVNGSKGRTLTHDVLINTVQLKRDDRLEPSDTLPDVADCDRITTFPTVIIFWRSDAETLARHRNPMFDPEYGVTPARSLTVDVLHAFFLGVLNVWCKISIWKLILSGCYGALGTGTENIRAAVLVLRDRVMRFYQSRHRAFPKENLTRVADLTVKMLGSNDDPKIKTKGAETWGFTLFLISELEVQRRMLEGEDRARLIEAGELLVKIVRIWKDHDWTIPRAKAQESPCAPADPKSGYTHGCIHGYNPLVFPWVCPWV